MDRYYSSTARDTTLTAFISNSATEIQVAGTDGFPQTPFVLVIDPDSLNEEIIDVTSVAGNTLTVTRGVDGSSSLTHNIGAVCRHSVSGRDFTEAMNHRNNEQSLHGIVGHVVGTTDEQTLTNKTIIGAILESPIIDGGENDVEIDGDVDLKGHKIENLADGEDPNDAINKGQLDAAIDAAAGSTVDAGTTYTTASGEDADVKNVGTQTDAIFDFYIPRGPKGERGEDGTDAMATAIILSTGVAQEFWPADGNFQAPLFEKTVQAQTGDSVWYNRSGGALWLFTADSTVPWTQMPTISGPPGVDGEPGEDGTDGLPGDDGEDGSDGKSAYEIAVENGFVGTEQEWLDSLKFGGEGYLALSGGTMQGSLVATATDHSQFQARNIKVSSLAPTTADGVDGDIWFQVGSAP